MAPEPREQISEITEIPAIAVLAPIWHFFAAIFWGAVGGLLGLIAFSLGVDFSNFELLDVLTETAIFGVLIGVFTLAGMLLIGMPVTMALYLLKKERTVIYSGLGAVGGFLFLPLVLEIPVGEFSNNAAFATSSAFAGLACAYRWGRWRERVAKANQAKREALEAQRRTNPIHELIH